DRHLCPKARTHLRIASPKPVAAWTQRACPQINNTCFQSNRARQQADALHPMFTGLGTGLRNVPNPLPSRDGYGAVARNLCQHPGTHSAWPFFSNV
ncbi:MAG: hypothetical protein WBW33_23245, partial [Bryobacteraceae bacterium]